MTVNTQFPVRFQRVTTGGGGELPRRPGWFETGPTLRRAEATRSIRIVPGRFSMPTV